MITQERLHELLNYNFLTGDWAWAKTYSSRAVRGQKAGCINSQGYNVIRIDGKLYRAARLAWFYVYDIWPIEIDHENTITSDDRWSNIYEATSQQNKHNRSVRYDNALLTKGIHKLPSGNFNAKIKHNYVSINLGTFKTLGEAVNARKVAEAEYHGEFANKEEARVVD